MLEPNINTSFAIGLIALSNDAEVLVDLTDSSSTLLPAIASLQPLDNTPIIDALNSATGLPMKEHRSGARWVVVLMTDGLTNKLLTCLVGSGLLAQSVAASPTEFVVAGVFMTATGATPDFDISSASVVTSHHGVGKRIIICPDCGPLRGAILGEPIIEGVTRT